MSKKNEKSTELLERALVDLVVGIILQIIEKLSG